MTTKAEFYAERKRYLDGEVSHHEFYLTVARRAGLTLPDDLFADVLRSKDVYYNDIPLARWDGEVLRQRYALATAQGGVCSLSDGVCALKALAREKRAAYYKTHTHHFTDMGAALRYYRAYGFDRRDVAHKLAEGEIAIGEPRGKYGESPIRSCEAGEDGRYVVTCYEPGAPVTPKGLM